MSKISTHVLDTSTGKPAANILVRLYSEDSEIGSGYTNVDGRCASLFASDVPLKQGRYRLVFQVETYFAEGFYPDVSISFVVRDGSANYHIPLLISPFGFTTYRGS